MDYLEQHPWRQLIASPISSPIEQEISEQNLDWEYLDGEMVKLGSLEHELLDIDNVQKTALSLLSNESKDLRILAHLLRTLQHSGGVLEVLLALQLLSDYVELYWENAPPSSELKKYRLTVQICKRFENAANNFKQSASRIEREVALQLLNKLHQYWQDNKLATTLMDLLSRYAVDREIIITPKAPEQKQPPKSQKQTFSSSTPSNNSIIDPIEVDASNERAWKNTLFNVVEYLLDREISQPLGYLLRRYAIWNNITTIPLAEENKTPLSPPSADRIAYYESSIANADIALWKDIEHSLTVSPYWFEGHYLSAMIAISLGYDEVANAIRDSVNEFLERLPQLKELYFSDGTAFCSERLLQWLSEDNLYINDNTSALQVNGTSTDDLSNEDIEIALGSLNRKKHTDLKDKFYDQIFLAQLLEEKGFNELAKQHYFSIYKSIENLSVKEWEDSLYSTLKQKLDRN
ncbi:type VI secretion system protein TssA [Avibacterium avium]|uniref:type VI secretion system protein TssA n=2 Tax=Avibacterium avium TaxID=751 RepID=UPI003BF82E61